MFGLKKLCLPTLASHNEREVLFVFAIIQSGGKQYKVAEGDVVFVEKLNEEEGAAVEFPVLAISDDNGLRVGSPVLDGAKVTGSVVKNGKGKKIYVMTYKAKKNEKTKQGHRQPYTKVEIKAIEG